MCNGFNSSERVGRDAHSPVSSAAAAEWLLREEPQPNLLLSNGPPPRELIGWKWTERKCSMEGRAATCNMLILNDEN